MVYKGSLPFLIPSQKTSGMEQISGRSLAWKVFLLVTPPNQGDRSKPGVSIRVPRAEARRLFFFRWSTCANRGFLAVSLAGFRRGPVKPRRGLCWWFGFGGSWVALLVWFGYFGNPQKKDTSTWWFGVDSVVWRLGSFPVNPYKNQGFKSPEIPAVGFAINQPEKGCPQI